MIGRRSSAKLGIKPSRRSVLFNKLLRKMIRDKLVQSDSVKQMRDGADRTAWLSPLPHSLHRLAVTVDSVPCEWLQVPGSQPDRVILYLHGGGFCLKALSGQYAMMARLCRLARARTLLVDYRLAPEHPFPAAPEDCFAVYRGLLELGVPAQNMVLCGDSAGGNLVMGVLLQAKEAGLPLPAGGVLMSPAVDGSVQSASVQEHDATDPFFNLKVLKQFRDWYLPHDVDTSNPLLSPVKGDLAGLPPLMIQVGQLEMLRDDSVKLAEKARQDGVQVDLHTWPGMPHVFPAFPLLPEAGLALHQMGEFIRACLEQSGTE